MALAFRHVGGFFFLPSRRPYGHALLRRRAASTSSSQYLLSRVQLLQYDADVGAVFHPRAGVGRAGASRTHGGGGLRLIQGWEEGQMLTVLSSALLVLFSLGANLTQDFGLCEDIYIFFFTGLVAALLSVMKKRNTIMVFSQSFLPALSVLLSSDMLLLKHNIPCTCRDGVRHHLRISGTQWT